MATKGKRERERERERERKRERERERERKNKYDIYVMRNGCVTSELDYPSKWINLKLALGSQVPRELISRGLRYYEVRIATNTTALRRSPNRAVFTTI